MANYTCTSSMTLEQCITAGSMVSGDDLTINSGAVVTCDRTPSILMSLITINYGKLFIDGQNIGSGNMINFVGNYQHHISVMGQGKFEIDGDWYSIGTTDGTNSQTFNLATYYNSSFCVDVVPMIQVETGRRINFDNSSGTAPEVDDFVYKNTDHGVYGRIVEVQSTYLVVKYLIGSLANNDAIEVMKVVDNNGPDIQISWTADVNHASGDILESGVYQEFGNSRSNGISYISYYHHGVGGFVFDNQFQSTTLTMGTAAGTTGGFVPPSGCNVRIPNVHMSTSNLTNYASNNTYHDGSATETNWYDLNTNNAGEIEFSICNFGNAIMYCRYASQYDCTYVGATVTVGSYSAGCRTTYNNCVVTGDPIKRAVGSSYMFATSDLLQGAEIKNCMKVFSERNRFYIGGITSYDIHVEGCIATSPGAATWNVHSNYMYEFNQVIGLTFKNNIAVGYDASQGPLTMTRCEDVEMDNFMFSMTQDETVQAGEYNALNISGTNIRVCGLYMLGNGAPGNYLIGVDNIVNFKCYCMGMIDDKVAVGTGDFERIAYVSGISNNLEFARIWLSEGLANTAAFSTTTIQKNINVLNCSQRYDVAVNPLIGDNMNVRGMHGAAGQIGSAWVGFVTTYSAGYGTHWHDVFRSDTTGMICLVFAPKTTTTDAVYTINAGNPLFYKDGDMDMVSGDQITFEMQYFALGHTGFSGVTTFTTSTSVDGADVWGSNVTKEFQYDNDGTGYNGTWLDLTTASNLTGITVSPSTGIKLKVRLTATATQEGMGGLFVHTTTTIASQKANFYPIDQVTCDVTLNGIVIGSRYWIYDSDTQTELAEGTAASTAPVVNVECANSTNLLIRVRKSSAVVKYFPFKTTAISNTTSINVAIIQTEDNIVT